MTRHEILQIAKPILFNTPMVGALLDNRKTATRRIVGQNAINKFVVDSTGNLLGSFDEKVGDCYPTVDNCRYQCGDYLYVREMWGSYKVCGGISYAFKADYIGYAEDENKAQRLCHGWCPSIHMPKEAARIFLRVTDVRVERLHDIDHATKIASEGVDIGEHCRQCIDNYGYPCCTDEGEDGGNECGLLDDIRSDFADLWNSTVTKADLDRYGWRANPWVWVIEFERVYDDGTP